MSLWEREMRHLARHRWRVSAEFRKAIFPRHRTAEIDRSLRQVLALNRLSPLIHKGRKPRK